MKKLAFVLVILAVLTCVFTASAQKPGSEMIQCEHKNKRRRRLFFYVIKPL